MSQRGILAHDQPFGVNRNSTLISDPGYGTPIPGAGPEKPTDRFTEKRVQFAGSFGGGWDVDLEGTVDGDNWVTIQANVTAAAIIEVAQYWRYMRLNTNVVGDLVSTGSPYGVADQPDFTASLGGYELDE